MLWLLVLFLPLGLAMWWLSGRMSDAWAGGRPKALVIVVGGLFLFPMVYLWVALLLGDLRVTVEGFAFALWMGPMAMLVLWPALIVVTVLRARVRARGGRAA